MSIYFKYFFTKTYNIAVKKDKDNIHQNFHTISIIFQIFVDKKLFTLFFILDRALFSSNNLATSVLLQIAAIISAVSSTLPHTIIKN